MAIKLYCDVCDTETQNTTKVSVGQEKKDVCQDCLDDMFNKKKRKNNNGGYFDNPLENLRTNVGNLLTGKR